jgi:hypothetical protein
MAKALGVIRTGGMAALILAWAVGGEVKFLAVVLLALFVVHHLVALAVAFVAYAAFELPPLGRLGSEGAPSDAQEDRQVAQRRRHASHRRLDHGWQRDRVRHRLVHRDVLHRRRGRRDCLAAATAFTIYAAIGVYAILGIEHAAQAQYKPR